MLDPLLFRELMDKKGEQLRMLLIVGDDAQLPSVCPGAFLRDLIASGRLPCTALTIIHRTGAGSVIAEKASDIARGEDGGIAPTVDGEDAAWTLHVGSVDTSKMRALQRARALHDAKEPFIVLAQTNHTVELLNSELQSFMNPPSPNKREVFASLNNDKGRRVWRENGNHSCCYEKSLWIEWPADLHKRREGRVDLNRW
jgi:exodeoxyribonuclease V alpha subunit